MRHRATWQTRCCRCGRFCVPADSSTPFGSYNDFESPDEDFYCQDCVKKERDYHIAQGWLPSHWMKADWEKEVAKVLGLIEAGPVGAAWSHWHKESAVLPEGWERKP